MVITISCSDQGQLLDKDGISDHSSINKSSSFHFEGMKVLGTSSKEFRGLGGST